MPAAIAGEEKYPYPASGLEKAIGYTFRNQELLLNALRHSSYSNETKKTASTFTPAPPLGRTSSLTTAPAWSSARLPSSAST